jgi:pimeloyl-ACP methyl ester carboxylesterase
MISLRLVGTEVSALSAAALSVPLRLVFRHERFEPDVPHPTPVVLVHGFLGDPTNFLLVRSYLAARGMQNFASFSYGPRLDYQRLARRLGRAIDALCLATESPRVDVVGHSLGGLVARYLIEMEGPGRIRRLVTMGSPYFANALWAHELSIFGESDPFVAPPHAVYGPHAAHVRNGGRVVVVPECGHWGLLYHPTVLHETTDFLLGTRPSALTAEPLALEEAS